MILNARLVPLVRFLLMALNQYLFVCVFSYFLACPGCVHHGRDHSRSVVEQEPWPIKRYDGPRIEEYYSRHPLEVGRPVSEGDARLTGTQEGIYRCDLVFDFSLSCIEARLRCRTGECDPDGACKTWRRLIRGAWGAIGRDTIIREIMQMSPV